MKRLLCQYPNATDATSFYRGVGVLEPLRKTMDLEISHNPPAVNWNQIKGCDAMFLQRPAKAAHLKGLEIARNQGKKIWIDYDDDLFNVPWHNRSFGVYGHEKTQRTITELIARADLVSVSTPVLQRNFRKIIERLRAAKESQVIPDLVLDPEKIILVPNAYDDEILSDLSKPVVGHQNTLVTWRGSGTHDKDLFIYTEAISKVVSRHLDWTYNFIGEPFWLTLDQLDKIPGIKKQNVIRTGTLDPIEYLHYLAKIKPALMIVPLEDNPFNRAKSNIAWLEATHAGAIVLAPNIQEWRRPGVLLYSDAKDFEDKMDRFIRGEFDAKGLLEESRAFILENLVLSKVNLLRKEILNRLFG